MMATKNKISQARESKQEEMGLFAMIMSDEDNGFCRALEELVLKKSTNNEIFHHIKWQFDAARKEEDFVKKNINNFSGKRSEIF